MDGVNAPLGSDELRVGTVDREAAVEILGAHLGEGRLSVTEYEERVSAALEARTRGDLRPLFRDLPAPYPAFMVPPVVAPAPPPAYPGATTPVVRDGAPAPVVHSDKSRLAAGVLQVVLPFGVGRFYTGHTGIAVAQLITAFMFVGVVWSIIDGILLLVNGGDDRYGRPLRD